MNYKTCWSMITLVILCAIAMWPQDRVNRDALPIVKAGSLPNASDEWVTPVAAWPSPMTLPTSADDLIRINQATNARLSEIAEQYGWPDSQPPTVERLQAGFFSRLLQEVKAESSADEVAAAMAAEMREAKGGAAPGSKQFSAYTSMLALPYLMEAGLCNGDVWNETGLICAYVDAPQSGKQVYGRHIDPTSGEIIQEIRRPPAGTEFARILRKAQLLSQTSALPHAQAGQMSNSPALAALAKLCNAVVPAAHAQTSAEAVCIDSPDVSTVTVVTRLDPFEFGIALYAQTFGLFSYETWLKRIYTEAEKLFVDSHDDRRKRAVETENDRARNTPGYRAKQRCEGQGTVQQKDACYDDHLDELSHAEYAIFGMISYFLPSKGYKTDKWGNLEYGEDGKPQPTTGPFDTGVGGAVAASVLKRFLFDIIHVEIYGEVYFLINPQVGTPTGPTSESDQVFVHYPFDFECVAHKCRQMSRCVAQGNNAMACGSKFARREDRQIRQSGSYLIHGINSCLVKPMPYQGQAVYQAIKNSDAVGYELPYDAKIQTRYQVPPPETSPRDENEDPCPPPQPVGNPTAPSPPTADQLLARISGLNPAAAPQEAENQGGHLCPPPTETVNLNADPLPPVFSVETYPGNPANLSYGDRLSPKPDSENRPPEQKPYWIYRFNEVRTSPDDYNLIFAGLQTTKTTYEQALAAETAARNLAGQGVGMVPGVPGVVVPYLYPRCDSTRSLADILPERAKRFYGPDINESAKEMHAFWYWHGQPNENRKSSPVAAGAMALLGYIDYSNTRVLDVLGIPYAPKAQYSPTPTMWGYIFGAAAFAKGMATDVGRTYKCEDFFTLPMDAKSCKDKEIYLGADYAGLDALDSHRFFPMPVTDIVLLQTLDHKAQCELPGEGDAPAPEPARFEVADVQDQEGNSGSKSFEFTVERYGDEQIAASVQYATKNSNALAGSDYEPRVGTLSFASGETTKTVNVPVYGDKVPEGDEVFEFTLSNAVNATLDRSTALGIIVEDDDLPDTANIVVADAASPEGDVGSDTRSVLFPVYRSGNTQSAVSVSYATADGTALKDKDYRAATGQIQFASGQTEKFVPVQLIGDYLVEPDRQFTITLSNPSPGVLLTAPTAIGTVQNDDSPFTVSVAGGSAVEGDAGNTPLRFTLTRTGAIEKRIPVYYLPTDDTAKAGEDYVWDSGPYKTLWLESGQQTAEVSIPIIGDTLVETDEQFNFYIAYYGATQLYESRNTVGVIQNDDSPSAFTVADGETVEGDGPGSLILVVSRTGGLNRATSVRYATSDMTARAGEDYVAASGLLQFAVGEASKNLAIQLIGDTRVEADETLRLTLTGATADALIAKPQGTGTIRNDDDAASLSVFQAQVVEGDSGAAHLEFSVMRTGGKSAVQVSYNTQNGSATAGSDYTAQSGRLSFTPPVNELKVRVPVIGDYTVEGDETLQLVLSAPSADAQMAVDRATGTIVNDDEAMSFSIADGALAEGDAGAAPLSFKISRKGGLAKPARVYYATQNREAIAGSDYNAASGFVDFAAGQTEAVVNVQVRGDVLVEPDEGFYLALSAPTPSNAAFERAFAVGSILNDDAPASFAVADATKDEGDAGSSPMSFVVKRTGGLKGSVSVSYATADGTAKAGLDYTSASGTLHFAANETSKTVAVSVLGDFAVEGDETFSLRLSNPSAGANLAVTSASGTIVNDDTAALLSIAPAQVDEGAPADSRTLAFAVTRKGGVKAGAGAWCTTADGSAKAGADYQATSQYIYFPPGDASPKTCSVRVYGDYVVEEPETLGARLAAPAAGTALAVDNAQGTILNDDQAAQLSVEGGSVLEGGPGQRSVIEFTVRRSGGPQPTSVYFITNDGSAKAADGDYQPVSRLVSFALNQSEVKIPVTVFGDSRVEPDESFTARLSQASAGASVAVQAAEGIIKNDDIVPPVFRFQNSGTLTEGDDGQRDLVFVLTREGDLSEPVVFSYQTLNFSATAGQDYEAANGSLTMGAGQTRSEIRVPVFGDTAIEPGGEVFFVTLSSSPASVTVLPYGIGWIEDDDVPPALLTASAAEAVEGHGEPVEAVFRVTRQGAPGKTVTVQYETQNGSAQEGGDFVAQSGTLEFSPSALTAEVRVPVLGDREHEDTESFSLHLFNPQYGTLAQSTVGAAIVDDDPQPPPTYFAVAGSTTVESTNGQPGTLTFRITRSGNLNQASSVAYATSDITAMAWLDYAPTSGTARFALGEDAVLVEVGIQNDVLLEEPEAFSLTLSAASGGDIATASAQGVILDEDAGDRIADAAQQALAVATAAVQQAAATAQAALAQAQRDLEAAKAEAERQGNQAVASAMAAAQQAVTAAQAALTQAQRDVEAARAEAERQSGEAVTTAITAAQQAVANAQAALAQAQRDVEAAKAEAERQGNQIVAAAASAAQQAVAATQAVMAQTLRDLEATKAEAERQVNQDTSEVACANGAQGFDTIVTPALDTDGNFTVCWSQPSDLVTKKFSCKRSTFFEKPVVEAYRLSVSGISYYYGPNQTAIVANLSNGSHTIAVQARMTYSEGACEGYWTDSYIAAITTVARPQFEAPAEPCAEPILAGQVYAPSVDADGSFSVCWSASQEEDKYKKARSYELQVATAADYSDAFTIYSGANRQYVVEGLAPGRHYFRVRPLLSDCLADWAILTCRGFASESVNPGNYYSSGFNEVTVLN